VNSARSGVLINKEGYVLTAAHVVHNVDSIEAHFVNGSKVNATVLGSKPGMGNALIALDRGPERIKPAKIGDSDKATWVTRFT